MSDETWTETHRETLEAFVMASRHKLLNELQERQLDAIDAALARLAALEADRAALIEQLAQCRRDYDARLAALQGEATRYYAPDPGD